MDRPLITVITPTTGRPSLQRLVESIERQNSDGSIFHLLLWDDFRDPAALPPGTFDAAHRMSVVLGRGFGRNGDAPGSPLRAVGLMAANTPWVTFADDDVWWEPEHVSVIETATRGVNWVSTLRVIWSPDGRRLGVDRFESVGDSVSRRVPYEMCDNNCMVFRRELGVRAAALYRETRAYNDDRLMYGFLKSEAGVPGKTGRPTINHVCPDRLVQFFEQNCSMD